MSATLQLVDVVGLRLIPMKVESLAAHRQAKAYRTPERQAKAYRT